MMRHLPLPMVPLLALASVMFVGRSACGQESLLERDVLPILTKHCQGCHGGLRQKGGLDLRTVPAMLKGGKSGPALKAGDPGASEMWTRVAGDQMPPGDVKLSPAEKNHLKQWIARGLPTVAERQKNDDPLLPAGRKHEPKQVAGAIDRHLDKALAEAKLQPAARADDAEFLRRATLDLTGRVPTAEQAAAFLDDAAADKRARLIDRLLATPEFGEQFGRTWRDWICPPELPSDGNGGRQPHREAQDLGRWLGQRLAAGDGWDRIVRDILTVDGEIKKQPQVIFFGLTGDGGKLTPDGTARAVASLFLGVQLQCSQCHDDPYRDWSQRDHWALAAFFGRINGNFSKVTEAAPARTEQIVIPKSAFKNSGTKVPAAFLGEKEFTGGQGGKLREQFARWLTAPENPYFARAFANRLWFQLFARGLVNPIDDFRALNPPTHPGLLALLAGEFRASGFDVKHLVRCLCNSEAYQRTSRVAADADPTATAGLTQAFGRMPLRLMTADQLYDSLKLAYGDAKLDLRAIHPKDGNTAGESAPVGDAYLEFLRRFGTNEEDATDFTHGIPQMLTMINHPRLLAGSKALDAFRKANKDAPPARVVEWLYLATLSRRPTAEESAEAVNYLTRAADGEAAQVGVLWMLVNRSEYMLVR